MRLFVCLWTESFIFESVFYWHPKKFKSFIGKCMDIKQEDWFYERTQKWRRWMEFIEKHLQKSPSSSKKLPIVATFFRSRADSLSMRLYCVSCLSWWNFDRNARYLCPGAGKMWHLNYILSEKSRREAKERESFAVGRQIFFSQQSLSQRRACVPVHLPVVIETVEKGKIYMR